MGFWSNLARGARQFAQRFTNRSKAEKQAKAITDFGKEFTRPKAQSVRNMGNDVFGNEISKALRGEESALGPNGRYLATTFMSDMSETIRGHSPDEYYDVIVSENDGRPLKDIFFEDLKGRSMGSQIREFEQLKATEKGIVEPISGQIIPDDEADFETSDDWILLR